MRTRWRCRTTLAGLIVGAALWFSIPAHADPFADYAAIAAPAVCEVLTERPTLAGVLGVAQGIVADIGFTYTQAGEVIAGAVYSRCPQHIALLDRFASTYGGPQVGRVLV